MSNKKRLCGEPHAEGAHFCTLEPGHLGNHVAGDSGVTWGGQAAQRIGVVRVRLVDVEFEGDSDAGVAMMVGLLNGLLDGRKGSSRT